ncbi:alpha/beta fold hydrolase [Halostagnicola bangensis]
MESAPTIPREVRETQRDLFDPNQFSDVKLPVTLLVGEESPKPMQDTIDQIAAAFDKSSVVSLSEQEHMAMLTAPRSFGDTVIDEI